MAYDLPLHRRGQKTSSEAESSILLPLVHMLQLSKNTKGLFAGSPEVQVWLRRRSLQVRRTPNLWPSNSRPVVKLIGPNASYS